MVFTYVYESHASFFAKITPENVPHRLFQREFHDCHNIIGTFWLVYPTLVYIYDTMTRIWVAILMPKHALYTQNTQNFWSFGKTASVICFIITNASKCIIYIWYSGWIISIGYYPSVQAVDISILLSVNNFLRQSRKGSDLTKVEYRENKDARVSRVVPERSVTLGDLPKLNQLCLTSSSALGSSGLKALGNSSGLGPLARAAIL